MPNIDSASIDSMLLAEQHFKGICIPMIGLHPCSVKQDFEQQLYVVEDWLSRRSFAAVGEMGTDLYWDKTFWPQQQEAFKIQADLAKKHKLPLVIHCRESMDETIDLLRPLAGAGLTGIFHCFSGTIGQAKEIASMDFYMGIGGVATFKNGGLDKVLPHIGIDRLVLETDSPYLAPVPFRGKRNEPSYVPIVGSRVAELTATTVDILKEVTTRNAEKIFGHTVVV